MRANPCITCPIEERNVDTRRVSSVRVRSNAAAAESRIVRISASLNDLMDLVDAYQPSDFFSSHITNIRSSVEQHDLYTLTLVVRFDVFRDDDKSVCFSHRAEYA